MAGGGLQKYTVQEVSNASIGQGGAMFLDTATAIVAPAGKVFVAITFLDNTNLDATGGLIAEDSDKWPNTEEAATAGGGTGGTEIDNSNTFPKGLTIYGRWTEIDISGGGSLIAYIG
tara:strand:+ start:239 stop:589 length:351 start_codon:yes stop_codon:yes gene_type:complete